MASAAEKLLERMRATKFGWQPKDFETLFSGHGYDSTEGKKHTTYTHPRHSDLTMQIPRHRDLKPCYARVSVRIIDELSKREAPK